MKIGFFDSGIGGLTVLHEALQLLPSEDYIYYADTYNAPYGQKPKETVRECILNAADFLAGKSISALVVACNTATSIAVDELRKRFDFPVIGMEPAVKPAVESTREGRVLVLATHLTLSEEKFRSLLYKVDKNHIVDFLPLTELVSFAEDFDFESPAVRLLLKNKFSALEIGKYETIVLGCTHFPYFRRALNELAPGVNLIDGSQGTVRNLKRVLEQKGYAFGKGTGRVEYYNSGIPVDDARLSGRYMELLKALD